MPYIKIESEKIFPAAFRKYQMDIISKTKESNISINGTSVKTNLADRAGEEVSGKNDNIFITNESGFPRA